MRLKLLRRAPGWLALPSLLCSPALALDLPAEVNGHSVNVIGMSDLPISQLLIDGAITVEAFDVAVPGPVIEVAGVPVILVEVHAGGNACEGPMPAIISLPKGEAPELYGPLDNCAPLAARIEADKITFAAIESDDQPALYVWTPEDGFTRP